MRYDWSRVYTTNYDNSIEIACHEIGKRSSSVTGIDEQSPLKLDELQIIHLHGFVERFRFPKTIKNECVLDYGSNVTKKVYEGVWGDILRKDIQSADVVVFVGYSMYDPEIAKLVYLASKQKTFFINSPRRDLDLEAMQSEFGVPVWIGREGFSRVLMSSQKSGQKRIRESYVCFVQPPDNQEASSTIRQSDLIDLFLSGNLDWAKSQTQITNGTENYTIRRGVENEILKEFANGANFISLSSRLGHGKSILSKNLASSLRSAGNRVFLAVRNHPEFLQELEEIISNYDCPIIIFDDFLKYKKHWDRLAVIGGAKLRILATARNNAFVPVVSEIDKKFLKHDPKSFKIDDFNLEEAKALEPLVTQAVLWGEVAEKPPHERVSLLRSKREGGFHGNFADVLVGLMKSSDIIGRFAKELEELKHTSKIAYSGILLIFYLEFANNDADVTLLQDGFGSDLKEFVSHSETSSLMNVFLMTDKSSVQFRSSIFSKFVLETICDPDDVLEIVKKTVMNLARSARASLDYERLFSDLLRFNYLKALIRDDNFNRIYDFYNELSSVRQISADDLFWVSFGMCERVRGNFGQARKHFEYSIALAKPKRFYTPYQAENQLIACILENANMNILTPNIAFSDFRVVLKLLTSQANHERDGDTGRAFAWHSQFRDFARIYHSKFLDVQRTQIVHDLKKYRNFVTSSVVNWQDRQNAPFFISSVDNFINDLESIS